MSVIQSTQKEIRYLKRKNLDEEARVIGNWYRDCIRMYGIDCVYWKLNTKDFSSFKADINQNIILKRAYGYDLTPVYDVSADMITFAEIDSDIFALNKYGIVPQTDINLVFDSTQFACDLAPKLGRYKEYNIDENEVVCEVPEFTSAVTSMIDSTGHVITRNLSDDVWPYEIGLGRAETYTCGILSGNMRCMLSGYELDKETTVMCDPYEHTRFSIDFPANSDLYRSLNYTIASDDYLETLLFLTFKVSKISIGDGKYKYVLRGHTHGKVLFFDIESLDKYTHLIHPDAGDIVEIDFPDENNREKYEITECYDKQLTQDGINPLLHKYVWKCKARRYISSDEPDIPPETEADSRLVERRMYEDVVQEEVAKKVSYYDPLKADSEVMEDAVYGGYQGVVAEFDKLDQRRYVAERWDFVETGTYIDIMRFSCGSRLVTDGFDLIFATSTGKAITIEKSNKPTPVHGCFFAAGTRWLKASDDGIVFVNVAGEAFLMDIEQPPYEINIDSMYIPAIDPAPEQNNNYDGFIKFPGTWSVVFATPDDLFVKLANGRQFALTY